MGELILEERRLYVKGAKCGNGWKGRQGGKVGRRMGGVAPPQKSEYFPGIDLHRYKLHESSTWDSIHIVFIDTGVSLLAPSLLARRKIAVYFCCASACPRIRTCCWVGKIDPPCVGDFIDAPGRRIFHERSLTRRTFDGLLIPHPISEK
jgi:hypothetical protein